MEGLLDGLIMGTVISGLSTRAEHVDTGAFGEADAAPAELLTKHLLGQSLFSGGDARGAVEEWETCVAEARLLQLDNAEGVIAANLGIAYHSLGEFKLSIQRLTRAVAIARRLCDKAAEGRRLCNLGSAYTSYGQQMRATTEASAQELAVAQHQHQLDKAVRLFQQALDISRELGDRIAEARRLGNLGIACRCAAAAAPADEKRQALARLAVQHDTDAATICREIGDRRNECRRYGNLGTAYDILGQAAEAVHHHTTALSIAREIGDRRCEGRILLNLGNVYYNHPDVESHTSPAFDEGAQVEHYRQALAIFKELGDERGVHNLRRVILAAQPPAGEEFLAGQGRADLISELEPKSNAQPEHGGLILEELAQAREDLRCHQLKMEHDAAEMSCLRQRRAEMGTCLARDSGEARLQQDGAGTAQHQQPLGIPRWVAAAVANEVTSRAADDARPQVANLYAAQSSMERMDDLIEAAEAARQWQPIAVGHE